MLQRWRAAGGRVEVETGCRQLLTAGSVPVVAHVENTHMHTRIYKQTHSQTVDCWPAEMHVLLSLMSQLYVLQEAVNQSVILETNQ